MTRSLLGYGVIAGPIYVGVGLAQAFTREGFDLSRHSLSLLANGPWGWVQIVNFVVCGLMALAAAAGIARATAPARLGAALIAVYGAALMLSGAFVADPMDGFPPGTPVGVPEEASLSGILHLGAGGITFIAIGAAFLSLGRWFARREANAMAVGSRVGGVLVLAGFALGAATATSSVGIALLWVAVLAGWGWLSTTSVALYRTVPHPDRKRR